MEFLAAHVRLLAELAEILIGFATIVCLGGLAIARLDRVGIADAIYFAFITAFTVGFGDMTPRSGGARVVTVLLAFVGLVLMGVLVAVAVRAIDVAFGPA